MLPMVSEARSLDLFTEITNYDESACDVHGSAGSGGGHRPG